MSPVFAHGRLRLYLLKLLDESPRHGYDVIRELEDRFMGLYSPSAGTVYPRLARLEAEGLVTHDVQEGRKVYRITDTGRAELAVRVGGVSRADCYRRATLAWPAEAPTRAPYVEGVAGWLLEQRGPMPLDEPA